MKKIAVVGYKGKMGQPIFLSLSKKYNVVGIGRDDKLEEIAGLDLVVDVASHESSVVSAEYCLKNRIPIIIGSTGQTDEENVRIEEISRSIMVIRKSNFSQGIQAVIDVMGCILKLNPQKVEIIEKHHIKKKDSPSGTALLLKDHIERLYCGLIDIQSIREGDEMGEHVIKFIFDDEEISIKHKVLSRMAFVRGLVKDVENIFKEIDKKV